MSNIIPFKPNKSPRAKTHIQDAAQLLIDGCTASGNAFAVFKKKFLSNVGYDERFAIGMALFHEGVTQIIQARQNSMDNFSDEDIRCLVSIVVDSLLSEEMELQ